jgi:hypothetical protein
VHPLRGMTINVCGSIVDYDNQLYCLLPHGHSPVSLDEEDQVHVSLAIDTANKQVVYVYRKGLGDPVCHVLVE